MFGLTIFQKDIAETTWEYMVTTVSVSVLTYLVAIASVIAVDWGRVRRRYLRWRHRASDDSTEGVSAKPAPAAQDGPVLASTDPEPQGAENLV